MHYFFFLLVVFLFTMEISALLQIPRQRAVEIRQSFGEHLERQNHVKQRTAVAATVAVRKSKELKPLQLTLKVGATTTLSLGSSVQERRLPTSTKRRASFESSVIASGDSKDLIKKSAEGQAWRVKSHGEDLENNNLTGPTAVQLRKTKWLRMHTRLRNVVGRFAPRAGGVGWVALLPTPTRIIRYGR